MSDIDDLEDIVTPFGPALRSSGRAYHRNSQPLTHCRRGHEMTPDNVYEYTNKGGYVGRQCKRCKKLLKLCRAGRSA